MKKRIIALTLALCLTVVLLPIPARAAVYSGSCGDSVTWTLDSKSGVLTINGTGEMWNYIYYSSFSPWYSCCSSIRSVIISSGVTSIGNSAFSDCDSLTSITIPEGVTSIGNWAFSDCTALTSITIPESVTSIGYGVFSLCSSLTSITIPESVTSIGDYAFYSCNSLTSITIPESVTSIGNYAFTGCHSLTSITIPESVTSIGESAFSDCTALTSITIPESVTSIGNYAFYVCTALTSITIPESVTSIGSDAFSYCRALTSITIPESVTSIGDGAFNGCSCLGNIYYSGTEEKWKEIQIGSYNSSLHEAELHFSVVIVPSPLRESRAASTVSPSTIIRFAQNEASGYLDSCTEGEMFYLDAIIPNASGLTQPDDIRWTLSYNGLTISLEEYKRQTEIMSGSDETAVRSTVACMPPDTDYFKLTVETKNGDMQSLSITVHKSGYSSSLSSDYYIEFSPKCETLEMEPYSMSGWWFWQKKDELVSAYVKKKDGSNLSESERAKIKTIAWSMSDFGAASFSSESDKKIQEIHYQPLPAGWLNQNSVDEIRLYGFYTVNSTETTLTCTVTFEDGKIVSKSLNVRVLPASVREAVEESKKWVIAYDNYVKAIKAHMEKENADLAIEAYAKMGAELEALDALSNSLITFYVSNVTTEEKKAVYEAVARFFSEKDPEDVSFEKIKLGDFDPEIVGLNLADKVAGWFDFHSYSYSISTAVGKKTITIGGFGLLKTNYRDIYCDNRSIATLITSKEQTTTQLQEYVKSLTKLSLKIIDEGYKEALRDLFGVSINGLIKNQAKKTITESLSKYTDWFAATGAGKVVSVFENCYDYYSHLDKLASAKSLTEVISAVQKIVAFEFKPDAAIISDKAVNRALKSLIGSTNSLNSWLKNKYSDEPVLQIFSNAIKTVIQCPVSVYVLDANGEVVGYVGDDDLWFDSDLLYIERYGDAKCIYTFADGYSLRVEGTDEGTLDCTVEKYQDNDPVERENYYLIPLSEGTIIDLTPENETLSLSVGGKARSADETFAVEEYENALVYVTCDPNDSKAGTTIGRGTYVRGDAVSLYATPESGYYFVCWEDINGNYVSSNNFLEFNAREDCVFTAVFAEDVPGNAIIYDLFVGDSGNSGEPVVKSVIYSSGEMQAYCAFYDDNGRILGTSIESVSTTGENVLCFDVIENAATCKVFVTDTLGVPQCMAKEIDIMR